MRFWKILYLLVVLLWPLSFGSAEARDQKLDVAYDQGLLSVSLENAELDEVLAIIGETTGISIQSPEDLNMSITITFDKVPLEDGLYRILRDIDHVLIFSPVDEKTGRETVSGVYILPEKITGSRTPRATPSVPRRAEPEEEREEDLEGEEILGGVREEGEEQGEDAVLERYEQELDQLEQQMEMVEEDSPQGKAIMNKIRRLQTQIERRLERLESLEAQ